MTTLEHRRGVPHAFLRVALALAITTGAGPRIACGQSSLPIRGVSALPGGATLEYGTVELRFEDRQRAYAPITFARYYATPPLVVASESGTAGTWIVVKTEGITVRGATIAARFLRRGTENYVAQVAYIVIGNAQPGVAAQGAPPSPAAKGADKAAASADDPMGEPYGRTNPPPYTLLDEKTVDLPAKAELTVELIVEPALPSAEGLRVLLNSLFEQAHARTGFRWHKHPTNIYIEAFLSEDHARSGAGRWIAQLLWIKGEHDAPRVTVRDDVLAALAEGPQTRFGLTEPQRKRIYWELLEAEYRANMEAESQTPSTFHDLAEDIAKRAEQLRQRYIRDLLKEHAITQAQLDEITREGAIKLWPWPPLPPE